MATTAVVAQERPGEPESTFSVKVHGPKALQAERTTTPPVLPLVVPPEDTCAGAQVIPGAGPFPHLTTPFDTTEATIGGGEPTPAACGLPTPIVDFSTGVWFTFTPAVTAPYTFSTCPTVAPAHTMEDSVLAIFTSNTGDCAGTFTSVACNDDLLATCGPNGRSSGLSGLNLTAGTTYFILAWRWDESGAPGELLQLAVSQTPAPVNDTCAGAVPLTLNRSTPGTLVAGQNDYTLDTSGGTACFQGIGHVPSTAPGRDSVFSFTAPAAGSYSFRPQLLGAAAGNLVAYTSPTCPAGGTAITCDASVFASNRSTTATSLGGAEEIYCQPMAEGETTYVFVDEHVFVASGGTFFVEAIACDRDVEPNDSPAAANALDSCPVEGTITAGDFDYWSIGAPPAGSRIFAQVDGVANNPSATASDFDMRVTTSTDTLEYDDGDNITFWGSFSPNVAGTPLTGEATYLQISDFNPANNVEPYRVYATVHPPGGDPYGSSATAEIGDAPVTAGGAQSAANGYFHGTHLATPSTNGFDQDLYKFCAMQGDVIQLGLDGDPGRNNTPYNPVLFLLNNSLGSIAGISDANAVSNNASGAGSLTSGVPNSPAEAITWRAQYTGTYYALAEALGGSVVPNDYLLSIGVNCASTASRTALLETTLDTDVPTVEANGEFVYIVRIENNGTDQALDAEFTDVLPAGVLFDGIAGTGTDGASCSLLPAGGTNGTVRCRVDCLRPGGFFEFYIFAIAPQCTGDMDIVNTVTVTSKTTLVEGSVLEASTTTPLTDPGTCDDGLFCTTGDACAGPGECVGSFTCEDNDPCTIDECSEENGCFNSFDEGALCDDGDSCTQIDICLSDPGGCVGFEPLPDGEVCEDSDPCTEGGTCGGGVCSGGTPTNCDDGDECTADSCGEEGCVNTPIEGCGQVCNEPNPATNGYWKRLCHGPHSGDELTEADAACVAGLGTTFAGVTSVADICAVLQQGGQGGTCGHTEIDLMSLSLNICHGRTCDAHTIDSQYGDNGTVGESFDEADAILSDPDRDQASCLVAKGLLEEINTGRALAVDSVGFTKLSGGGARVQWQPMGGGNEPIVHYNVWRRVAGSLAAFTKITETTSTSFDDTTPGNFEYEVTPVR